MPISCRYSTVRITIILTMVQPTALEVGPIFWFMPGSSMLESSKSPQLSITMSQTSYSFLPLLWRLLTWLVYSILVIAMVVTPIFRASIAISMAAVFRPETEWSRSTSPSWMGVCFRMAVG